MSNGNSWIPPEEFKVKMSIMVGNYALPFQETSNKQVRNPLIFDMRYKWYMCFHAELSSLLLLLFRISLEKFAICLVRSCWWISQFQSTFRLPCFRCRLVGLVRNRPGLKFGRRNLRHFHHLNNRPKSRSAARHRWFKPPAGGSEKIIPYLI